MSIAIHSVRKSYGPWVCHAGPAMAGLLPSRRAATGRGVWARELRRAAVLFAASVALFWGSSASGRWILPVPDSAPVFGDLVLDGILFGRIAGSLEPRFRYLADVGALVLFTVAAATIVVILQSPGTTGFVQAWSLSLGILPGAAVFGYALLALGITAYPAPANPR